MDEIKETPIEELISRRADLSSFIVHLTRIYEGKSAKENLESIIRSHTIEARNPMGMGASNIRWINSKSRILNFQDLINSQRAVSFTECPLEHLYAFVEPIEWRDIKLEPYGIAFTKAHARELGLNPIWYVDQTPSVPSWLSHKINNLIAKAVKSGDFLHSDIASIVPLFEIMQPKSDSTIKKEFWWEREWRHVGDVNFYIKDIALGICPEEEIEYFEELSSQFSTRKVRFINIRWSLETIIAKLAGWEGRISPFEPYED